MGEAMPQRLIAYLKIILSLRVLCLRSLRLLQHYLPTLRLTVKSDKDHKLRIQSSVINQTTQCSAYCHLSVAYEYQISSEHSLRGFTISAQVTSDYWLVYHRPFARVNTAVPNHGELIRPTKISLVVDPLSAVNAKIEQRLISENVANRERGIRISHYKFWLW